MAIPGVYTKEEQKVLDAWREELAGMGGWLRPELGKGHFQTGLGRVATKEFIAMVASVMDYWNPLWRNEDYAKHTRWGGIIAPPFFKQAIQFGGPFPHFEQLTPPSVGYVHLVYCGTNYRFYKPIHVNDTIRLFLPGEVLKDVTNPDGSEPRAFLHNSRAPRGRLTTKCHGYIIGDRSDEGRDASSPIEMGNPSFVVSITWFFGVGLAWYLQTTEAKEKE